MRAFGGADATLFSFQAIISGGLFGAGIGMSSLKFIGLPVAHTDSIFGPSVRPSELAKLVVLIYVAVWLDAKSEVLNDISVGLVPLIII
ncbi:MAG: FtsW/RodA/SpoVE family cell cycle protein, partial [Deltaproteobacteria bacterium]|nr:FtsW/RodA/SpoVE family cell cycle protein [Deltaproteobacteria bacterium]